MVNNSKLHNAKSGKKDEFYTQLTDIEKELTHYRDYFKNKTVYCNCDDPYESNFFKYFALNFNFLKLKKLIATCYSNSVIANTQLSLFNNDPQENKTTSVPHKIIITEIPDLNHDGCIDLSDTRLVIEHCKGALTRLKGNGDFNSSECIELLKESDIVVTNPPFSLFRIFVSLLFKYDKKFIIIGNQNAITYKEIFPLIQNNKMWLGYGFKGGAAHFINTKYQDYATANDHKEGMIRVSGVVWFTNIEHKKRHEELSLYKKYTPEEYPTYDNYDAIEVSKTAEIPIDYKGVMGVPITFLDKYCPEQFEIIGATQRGCHDNFPDTRKYNTYWEVKPNGIKTGSSGGKTNENANLLKNDGKKNYFINSEGRVVQSCYQRIFIKYRNNSHEN